MCHRVFWHFDHYLLIIGFVNASPVGLTSNMLTCNALPWKPRPLAHSFPATATTSPTAMPGSQPNRAHIQCRRQPFHHQPK